MKIQNNYDNELKEYKTKRRVIKSWENIETKPIYTSKEDNIDRAGFLSIEQQYEAFKRAGINAVERLKTIYPDTSIALNEEDLMKNKDIVKMAEKGIREPLDAIDRQITIEKSIKSKKDKITELQQQNRELEKKIKEQQLIEKGRQEATTKTTE